MIAWSGSGFPENADVRFLWRTDYAPSKLNSVPVTIAAGRLTPVVMAKNPDWVGRVTGIALAVRGPLARARPRVGRRREARRRVGQFADRLREWLAFEGWSGTSINTITGGADVQELPLPTLLVVALLVAVVAWFAFAWRGGRLAALPAALAVLFLAAWIVLDVQWTWNLARQVAVTRAQYGGKDWRERHAAAEDGPLFQFVERARAQAARRARARLRRGGRRVFPRARGVLPLPAQRALRSVPQYGCRPQAGCGPAITSSSTSAAASRTTPTRRSCASKAAKRWPPKPCSSSRARPVQDHLNGKRRALRRPAAAVAARHRRRAAAAPRRDLAGRTRRDRVDGGRGLSGRARFCSRHGCACCRWPASGSVSSRWRRRSRSRRSCCSSSPGADTDMRCPRHGAMRCATLVLAPQLCGRRPRHLVGGGRVDRAAVRAARRRDRVAPALPVGRVDAVGDQGARLVRTGISRAVRARQRVAGRQRHRLLRRIARVSADDAAPAGVRVPVARAVGRHADELAVVAGRRRAGARRVRRPALAGRDDAGRAGRRVPRRVAAARQRPRRARRLRGPADGRVVHRRGARAAALDAKPRRTRRGARAAARDRVHADQEPRVVLGGDPRARDRRRGHAAPRRSRRGDRLRGRRSRARRARAVQVHAVQLPGEPHVPARVGRPGAELLPARQLAPALVWRDRRRAARVAVAAGTRARSADDGRRGRPRCSCSSCSRSRPRARSSPTRRR